MKKERNTINNYNVLNYHDEFFGKLKYLLKVIGFQYFDVSVQLSVETYWQCSTLIDSSSTFLIIILFHMISAPDSLVVEITIIMEVSGHHQQLWIAVSQLISTV